MTPAQTRQKSPLYHIDELSKGDQLYVDYAGTRYAYEVTSKYAPSAGSNSIESPSSDARLTLYSCDSLDPKQIREVIEAKPVGTIAWVNGIAKLKTPEQL
jgi:LPXTG-site transpeptidase (sortase) family protein